MNTADKIIEDLTHYFKAGDSSPNGFSMSINFGNKVKTESIANNMAIPVKTPK